MPTNALASPGSTYDDSPAPEFNSPYVSGGMRRVSEDRAVDSGYGASSPVPVRKSIDDYAPRRSQDDYYPRRGEENYGMDAYGNRRRPSQDTTGRRSEDRERDLGRRPSQTVSVHSDSTSTTNAQSATAGMVIPNKSTIAEEEIEVPYGREVRDSTGTAVDDRERSRDRGRETDTDAEDEFRSPAGGLGGLSGLTARLQAEDDEDEGALSGNRSAEDYYDKMSFGRASVTSDRSAGARGGRASVPGEEGERIRRDYEFKVATMQSRITNLERDLEDAQAREQKWGESEERVRMMEEELEQLRMVRVCPRSEYNFSC